MPQATKAPLPRTAVAPLPKLQDADLVGRARAGDERAFEEIVRRYRQPLIRYSTRHVGRDHAEDVTQHALASAATHLRDDPRPIHLRAWLYRVAHNAALNMRARKDWSHDELSPDIDGVPQPPELAAQRTEVRETVSQLDRLPERQRAALLMSVFEGLGYEEIASRLDTTPSSVRALLSRARSQLRRGAAAILPLPLIESLMRKAAELVSGTGSSGTVAAGSNVAQAKIVALAATTVVAGAATAERATSLADSDRGDEPPVAITQPASTPPALAVPPGAFAALATVDRETAPKAASKTGGEDPAREAPLELTPAETSVEPASEPMAEAPTPAPAETTPTSPAPAPSQTEEPKEPTEEPSEPVPPPGNEQPPLDWTPATPTSPGAPPASP